MATMDVTTHRREEFVDITRRVDDVVRESGVQDGWALVYCPHTTAALCVNENADPDVPADVIDALSRLCPLDLPWRHVEGNADAHSKAVLVGESVTIPVRGGALALGTWQGVFFCEFDGPRRRSALVSVLGE